MPFSSFLTHSIPFSHSFSLYFPVILLLRMSSAQILWSTVFLLLLVDCATILFWFFFGHVKKRRPHKNEIFICGDCWLLVFDFLAPSQLGLGIALVNRRFNCIVDEHFKTRKWKLGEIRISHKIGENGTKQMQIVNSDGNPLPIPQNPLPNKVIGFRGIKIAYIDHNVIAFLRRFHRIFAVYSTELDITTGNERILKFVLLNFWPILRHSIHVMFLNSIVFRCLRQLAPSLLNECPSLCCVFFDGAILPAFPPDDSANASDGQAVTKWLFTPRPDGLPKVLSLVNSSVGQWSSTIELIKTAFSNASSPVPFCIYFLMSSPLDFIVPFDLINEVTGEELALIQSSANDFWLIRFQIGWDERKWDNVKDKLKNRTNPIVIRIKDGGFDDGLLDDASPGPNDQQQK